MSLSEVIPYTPALFSGILRRGSRSWRVAVVRDEECTVVVGKSEARYHSEDLVVDGRIILTLRLLMSYIYIYIYIYMKPQAAHLLRSWVRIPPGAWIFVVSVVCCQVEVSATS